MAKHWDMENLKTYLADRSKRDFAKAIGTTPSYLSQILSTHRKPSLALMLKIQAASDGVVDLNSWSPDANPSLGASKPSGSLPTQKRGDAVNELQGQDRPTGQVAS